MTRLLSFPKIDLTSLDLNKLRSFELPTFDLPKVDLSTLQDELVEAVKNAAYLTIGLAAAAVDRVAKLAA